VEHVAELRPAVQAAAFVGAPQGQLVGILHENNRASHVEKGAGDGFLVDVDQLPGQVRALFGGTHVAKDVKVEELPGSLQVPANSVLADAEELHHASPDRSPCLTTALNRRAMSSP
jgi:hypothetical protein